MPRDRESSCAALKHADEHAQLQSPASGARITAHAGQRADRWPARDTRVPEKLALRWAKVFEPSNPNAELRSAPDVDLPED